MYSQAYLPAGLGDDGRAAVADTESVARPTADEDRAAGRAVADVVAGHALNFAAVIAGGVVERHDDVAAGDALGDAVLGEAAKFQVEAVDAPGTEALARPRLRSAP